MKYLFRCDSSYLIGTGHVMRCLRLARALARRGHECCFAVQDRGICYEKDFGKEFGWHQLPEANLPGEVCAVNHLCDQLAIDWIILDHYDWTEDLEAQLKPRLMVVDDLGRRHQAQALLDMNYYSLKPPSYQMVEHSFVGPGYVILPSAPKACPPKEKVERIVFFWGGTDPLLQTERMIRLIETKNMLSSDQVAVMLTGNKKLQIQHPQIEQHPQVADPLSVMGTCDLYVGSGGSITWERASLGLPSLCLSVAQNQERGAQELHQRGCHRYLGRANEITDDQLVRAVQDMCRDFETRKEMSQRSLDLKVGEALEGLLDFLEKSP